MVVQWPRVPVRIVAEHSWSYEWFAGREDVRLPATEKNTVAEPAD
ncbi:hypothetical protein SAMN05421854_11029 [Amycolatopsis rubida]|uniref:Uncharacterized protein n=1 Tax=Amycolatopsis rubida TaxID=112413 RepID=A0A1I5X5D3_9PSEU|nr:hypothetical protein SAMN05421854_11029 [Amycolatopsis rubida]